MEEAKNKAGKREKVKDERKAMQGVEEIFQYL